MYDHERNELLHLPADTPTRLEDVCVNVSHDSESAVTGA